jgi:hypothetical protein
MSTPAASAHACRSNSLPSASKRAASIISLPIMSAYVIVLFLSVLLLSAPAPNLLFSMITYGCLCGFAHFKTAVSPRPYGPLFAASFCVSVPEGTV